MARNATSQSMSSLGWYTSLDLGSAGNMSPKYRYTKYIGMLPPGCQYDSSHHQNTYIYIMIICTFGDPKLNLHFAATVDGSRGSHPKLSRTLSHGKSPFLMLWTRKDILGCPRKLGSKVIGSVGFFTPIHPPFISR